MILIYTWKKTNTTKKPYDKEFEKLCQQLISFDRVLEHFGSSKDATIFYSLASLRDFLDTTATDLIISVSTEPCLLTFEYFLKCFFSMGFVYDKERKYAKPFRLIVYSPDMIALRNYRNRLRLPVGTKTIRYSEAQDIRDNQFRLLKLFAKYSYFFERMKLNSDAANMTNTKDATHLATIDYIKRDKNSYYNGEITLPECKELKKLIFRKEATTRNKQVE